GVARHAVADDLAVDFRAARLGALVVLEHHDTRALAHDEAVAVLVIGARALFGVIVEIGGERPTGGEAGERDAVDAAFRAAGDHHVGIAHGDDAPAIADGVRAGRAGRHYRVVRALEPEADRDVAGGEVDQAAGNEERADAARPLLVQHDRGFVD